MKIVSERTDDDMVCVACDNDDFYVIFERSEFESTIHLMLWVCHGMTKEQIKEAKEYAIASGYGHL